jgi:hypothetical protein
MKNIVVGVALLGALFMGCGGDKAEAPKEGEALKEGAAEKTEEKAEEKKEEAPVAEEKVEDAGGTIESQVAAWCAAQTKGDFVEYSSFYASKFEGIKRTKRGKEKKFDNTAWMKDRKGMFKMPLQVDCKGLKVGEEKDGVTSVTFEQYWQSPSYADEGPKRLDWKFVDDNLVIVGEEMIKSTKWDRKKFKDGSTPPKRAFKTYDEIGDHPMAEMVSKKGHKEYRQCHFTKPKSWGGGDEEEWPVDCEIWASGMYGMWE